jgi:hypothetical protein
MSKFDKVFEARETDKPEKKDERAQSKSAVTSSNKAKPDSKGTPARQKANSAKFTSVVETAGADSSRKRGRPPAKRSDPAYVGFTTYIRKDTHLKVKIALLQEGGRRELSELVEELLSKWTKDI